MAISIDNQIAEAYSIRGEYYFEKGNTEKALEEYNNALKFNPNDWLAYRQKGHLNRLIHGDFIGAIENYLKAASLNHGPEFSNLLRWTSYCFYAAGFLEEGDSFAYEALKTDGDTLMHSYLLSLGGNFTGNMEGAIEILLKSYAKDSSYFYTLSGLGFNYFFLSDFEKSYEFFKKYVNRITILGILTINNMHRIGYAYLKNGYENEAEFYLNEQMKYCEEIIKLNRNQMQNMYVYYDLAGVFAVRGEKDKAYKNLRIFNQKSRMASWAVTHFKYDPLFESIRDEPEFQQILLGVEAKYQAEHERVRLWLEEQDMF
jgi:tetratricopeptide (TPR) repeat protein